MEEDTLLERLEKGINIIQPQGLDFQLKLYDIFIPILCSVIIPINLLVCLSSGLILHKRQQPRSTYILLGNVALSDLLIGTVTLVIQYCPNELRNEMVCCISLAIHVCSTIVSMWTLGLIGIDRFLYILYGLYYQRLISSQRTRGMVIVLWVLAAIFSFLPAFGLRNSTDDGKFCWFIVLFPQKLVLFITIFAIIPLGLIIVLYSIILKNALGTISDLHRASMGNPGTRVGDLRLFRGRVSPTSTSVDSLESPNSICLQEDREVPSQSRTSMFICCRKTNNSKINFQVYSANKWKAIKIVLLTTGAFAITWLPYFIAVMLYTICAPNTDTLFSDSILVAIAKPLTLLGMCNSLLNPIIYAWWHNGFRESVKKIFKGLLGQRFQAEETNMVIRLSQERRSTTRGKQNKNSTKQPPTIVVFYWEMYRQRSKILHSKQQQGNSAYKLGSNKSAHNSADKVLEHLDYSDTQITCKSFIFREVGMF